MIKKIKGQMGAELKRLKTENEELQRKVCRFNPARIPCSGYHVAASLQVYIPDEDKDCILKCSRMQSAGRRDGCKQEPAFK